MSWQITFAMGAKPATWIQLCHLIALVSLVIPNTFCSRSSLWKEGIYSPILCNSGFLLPPLPDGFRMRRSYFTQTFRSPLVVSIPICFPLCLSSVSAFKNGSPFAWPKAATIRSLFPQGPLRLWLSCMCREGLQSWCQGGQVHRPVEVFLSHSRVSVPWMGFYDGECEKVELLRGPGLLRNHLALQPVPGGFGMSSSTAVHPQRVERHSPT